MLYDAKFGRKRLAEPQDYQAADALVSNGTASNVTSNGNHSVKNSSEMAIYEQYRKQVYFFSFLNVKKKRKHFCVFID